eukprot:GEZU01001743.1.p1 GENE.GEZU01001743.1~~GEZU01001743.1.p1  ORF type:complete len:156 (-),score=39.23 GEZU01001743.1:399-845(-)
MMLRNLVRRANTSSITNTVKTTCNKNVLAYNSTNNTAFFSSTPRRMEENKDDDEKWRIPWEKMTPLTNKLVPPRKNNLDVKSFLEKIGKGCGEYADKFESWEDLFTARGVLMKERGIPVAQRKWIMHWCQKYRNGDVPGIPPAQKEYD